MARDHLLDIHVSQTQSKTSLKLLLQWRVTALTVVLGILSLGLGFRVVYQHSRDASFAEINQNVFAIRDTASIAIYTHNKVLGDDAVHVLINNPLICSAKVEDNQTPFKRIALKNSSCVQQKTYRISSPFASDQPIGLVVVGINEALVEERALRTARLISVMMLLVLLGSSISLALASQTLLTRPLTELARTIHALKPGTSFRLQIPKIHRNTELGVLIEDINQLLKTVEHTLNDERMLRMFIHALQQQYQSIFDQARTGIALIDETGRCMLANPAFANMLGLNFLPEGPFCMLPNWLSEHFPPESPMLTLMERARGSTEIHSKDIALDADEDDPVWLNVSVSTHLSEQTSELTNSPCRMLECILIDISERKREEEEHRFKAQHDLLTGLFNRSGGEAVILDHLRNHLDPPRGAILVMDLDRFKLINDTYGHAAGDLVLKKTAERLKDQLRSIDVIARLGGDEFMIGLFHVESFHALPAILDRILAALTSPIELAPGQMDWVGASIGICVVPEIDSYELSPLLQCADEAMYRVKRAGKCGYCIYNHQAFEEVRLFRSQRSAS